MPLSLADLDKGYEFPPTAFELSPDWIDEYTTATQDASRETLGSDVVPPMAVAALSVRAMLENASLPPGSIHAAQELAFHGAAHTGDTVTVNARIASRGQRAGWVLMGVALEVSLDSAQLVTGRATLSFPVDGSV
jgi:acyl dehydratase